MRGVSWKARIAAVGVVVVILALVAVLLQRMPAAVVVPDDARRVSGADFAGSPGQVGEYRAGYRRWTSLLGFTVDSSEGLVTVERTEPGSVDVLFDLSNFGLDRMRLNDADLMLEERAFGDPAGAGQSFRRNGDTIEVQVRSGAGDTRDLSFTYPVPVLEPSVLEIPLGLLELEPGNAGYMAWSNFADEAEYWLAYRALRRSTITAAGRTFETTQVRVRFPSGAQRDYWLVPEPPYKIRMVSYDRGRLITSGWELVTLEVSG